MRSGRLTIRIDRDERGLLDRAAEELGVSLGSVVRSGALHLARELVAGQDRDQGHEDSNSGEKGDDES